ncbi:hypothetical protein OCU04_012976 [Sclerotinia nivalis]|uniref:FAD-binding PCMH-type domain-containing protein n=1 Tax=Sclerotinia nivalis TaxID=352851 RepID=A0A9X0A9I4_9HELO|nr:hypothetical protein OCU04_012976 [Sclerotinia nivalis]
MGPSIWKVLIASIIFSLFTDVSTAAVNISGLKPLLSSLATIVNNTSGAPRWSDFDAPTPGAVVNVATENDVLVTVRYCIAENIPFLAQNGGHGWSTTLDLYQNGILINLAGIKAISFNSAKTQITFQGGALISDVVDASFKNSVLVPTGTCNCVGTIGAVLGGGFGNLIGIYGFGVDNLISMNVVTPSGTAITVSPTSNTDLWWAMRGAGPNFGIVTSAVMKSYPVASSLLNAWTGPLIFTGAQLEALIEALSQLDLQSEMSIAMFFLMSDNSPIILVTVFYYGTEAAGKAAFAPLYSVGPIVDGTAILPYNEWNSGGDSFCAKGDSKPSWGIGLAELDVPTWTYVWNEWLTFAKMPGANNSAMILDMYSLGTARKLSDSSSAYPFRSTITFNAIATAWYSDPTLDAAAEVFGSNVRDLLRSTSGLCDNSTYINNGFGDESLSTVYGDNLSKLQAIKKRHDPLCKFCHWYPLI